MAPRGLVSALYSAGVLASVDHAQFTLTKTTEFEHLFTHNYRKIK